MQTTRRRPASTISAVAIVVWGTAGCLIPCPAFAQTSLADLLGQEALGPAAPGDPATGQVEPAAASSPARAGVPPKKTLTAAEQKMRVAFAGDIAAASTAEAKRQLATRFLELGIANLDSNERWVLFTEALSLAVDAADIPLTEKIISEIANLYAVDGHEARLAAYTKLAQARNLDPSTDLVQALLDTATAAADESRFQTAEKAIKLAIAQARKQRNDGLVKHAANVQKAMVARQKAEQELADLREKLASSPNDAALATQVGKKLCFYVDDWESGLPLLAKGSDAALARLATAALALPQSPAGIAAVGEAWWQWAESQDQSVKAKVRQKAAALYRKAAPGLTGLDRAAVDKRIAEAGVPTTRAKGTGKTVYLVDLPAPTVTNMHSHSRNGTYGGEPILCQGKNYEKAIISVPKIASTATVKYDVPSSAVALVGAVGLFTIKAPGHTEVSRVPAPAFFEIYADGIRLWRSPPFNDSTALTPFEVPLSAPAAIELRVVFESNSGQCQAAWLDPYFSM
jgi:hypothetical protein